MPRKLALFVLIAIAAATGLYAFRPAPPMQANTHAASPALAPSVPTLAARIERDVVSIDPALLDAPPVKAYAQRQQFDARVRRFFAEEKTMPPATRDTEAQAIARDIDRYERDVQLSAGEAMNLRIGLARATTDDEKEQAERIADIVELYRKDAAQREAKWLAQQKADTAFTTYKARELDIVNEVMAMPSVPGGVTREEYLRRRLQAERVTLSHP